jgi:hypothetical protein
MTVLQSEEYRKSCICLLFDMNNSMYILTFDVRGVESRIGIGTSVSNTNCSAELGLIICC